MKVTLYQIEQEYINLAETLIENGGELTPELETQLTITKDQLQNKGVCYGMVIKDIEAENDVIDTEIKRLTELKKSRSKAIDRLKDNLSQAMQLFELEEIKTPLININFRSSQSVEVDVNLDQKYVKTTVSTAPDKVAIKEAIKSGVEVTGARLVTNQNIQIK
jgi:hypothetical protein